MAHQADSNVIDSVLQLLSENGLSHRTEAMRLLLNEAMRIERSHALEAAPYQRTESRRGYANGFKPKRFRRVSANWHCRSPKFAEMSAFIPPLWSADKDYARMPPLIRKQSLSNCICC